MTLPVIHVDQTDSTNNYLKDLILHQEVEEGTAVVSAFQTAGKGQRGNSWESEQGKNLLFSMVLYPQMIEARDQFVISRIVSLAVADCLLDYTDHIAIKWPNDIYWKDRKICGILIENNLSESYITQSVIGIGINLNQEEFISNAPNPVSLKQITGVNYDLAVVLEKIRVNILNYYKNMQREAILLHIHTEYKKLLYRRDGYYLYNDGRSDFYARIADVETDGMLVLETKDGMSRRFAFKEVRFVIS